jgi:hypothetical protein
MSGDGTYRITVGPELMRRALKRCSPIVKALSATMGTPGPEDHLALLVVCLTQFLDSGSEPAQVRTLFEYVMAGMIEQKRRQAKPGSHDAD